MNEFLQKRLFLKERLDRGEDIHPSDWELKEFQTLAKRIDADRYFTIYGCQDCVKTLVKFVFDHQETFVHRQTFPFQKPSKTKKDGKE